MAAATQGELIDAKDTCRDNRSIWDCPDQAQQRGPARRHGQAHAMTTAGATTEREPGDRQVTELPGRVGLPEAGRAVQGRCQDSLKQRAAAPASRQHGKWASATLPSAKDMDGSCTGS